MLQKSTLTIPLGLGVNTKADDKLVEQGKFNIVAENASFEKIGAVKKRQAFENVSSTYYNPDSASGTSGSIGSLTYLPKLAASVGDSIFLRCENGEYLYQHNDSFVYRPSYPVPECRLTSKNVYSSKYTITHTDCSYDSYEDVVVAAARDAQSSNGLAKLVIYDIAKGSVVYNSVGGAGASGSSNFGFVRAGTTRVGGQSYYHLIYVDQSDTLNIYTFNKFGQQVGTVFTQANVPGGIANGAPIAICKNTAKDTIYIIVPTKTSGTARFISFSGSSVVVNTTFALATAATSFVTSSARYDSGSIRFAYTILSNVQQMVLSTAGAITSAEATIFTTSSPVCLAYNQSNNELAYTEGIAGASWAAVHGRWDGSSKVIDNYNCGNYTDSISSSYGLSLQVLAPIIRERSDVTANGAGAITAFFLCPTGQKSSVKTISRLLPDQADVPNGQASRLASVSSTHVVAALPRLVVDNTDGTKYNLSLCFFELAQDYKSGSRALIGNNAHIQGGFLSEFDGKKLFENGFHLKCPPPWLAQSGTGLTGTYNYCCVLRYVDKSGQITRSAPSVAISTGAITNKGIQIAVRAMPFGVKATDCTVEIYRTTNGGATFYFLREVPADTMTSSADSWSASVIDTSSDSTIQANAILYTDGDVLQNDPAPACKHVSQWGNRIFCVGLEDDNEIAYSKSKLYGECVNFSDFFRVRVDTSQYNIAGGCVAGQGMDDKFIIFKRNSIFFISGSGPNETGVGEFSEPTLITSETGCTEPRSVVLTPKGIMFKGDKGIYLLSRGLETVYIGAAVEQYNSLNCVSSVHVDKKNLVNFVLKSGGVGVIASYDYYTEQWAVIPDRSAVDGDLVDGNMMILESSIPAVQNGTDFTDNSGVYSAKIKTPWIKVSGLQDFARIWSCTILGKYKSAHTLTVNVKYDYDEAYTETYSVVPSVSDAQYEYRIHLKKQKCVAVQFEIYDSSQVGESMELTALTLECGLKKGSAKLPAARKY
jgi:hypothetical protein